MGGETESGGGVELSDLFFHGHVKPRAGLLAYIRLALYAPFGVALVVFRLLCLVLVCTIIICTVALSFSAQVFYPPWLVRCFLPLFGILLDVSGNVSTVSRAAEYASNAARTPSAATGESTGQPQARPSCLPLLLASNHCTAFDVFPFLGVTPLNVLIDKEFFSNSLLSAIFKLIIGAVPIDRRHKMRAIPRQSSTAPNDAPRAGAGTVSLSTPTLRPHVDEGLEQPLRSRSAPRVHAQDAENRSVIKAQINAASRPFLFFPEGWDTSGQRGTLLFQKFLFSLDAPVLPVAMRVDTAPFLPCQHGLLGTSIVREMLWMFFVPYYRYRLHFLEPTTRGPLECDLEFAARVQRSISQYLRIEATTFTYKDALALRRTKLS